jgi:hypothetical protein
MPQLKTSAIKRFALTSGAWTEITAPIPCSYYQIIGNEDGVDMLKTTDQADAEAQYTMRASGQAYSVIATAAFSAYRFLPGAIVCWMKSAGGNTKVIVEFVQ